MGDYRMYGALINAPLKEKPYTEEDLKVHWTNQVFSAPTGGCPQGNLWFNANHFKTLHSAAFTEFTMQTVTCDVILKVFLTKAVYEGYQVFSVPTKTDRASPYPTMGAKLFEGTGGHETAGDFAEGAFQVKNEHVPARTTHDAGLLDEGWRRDRSTKRRAVRIWSRRQRSLLPHRLGMHDHRFPDVLLDCCVHGRCFPQHEWGKAWPVLPHLQRRERGQDVRIQGVDLHVHGSQHRGAQLQ